MLHKLFFDDVHKLERSGFLQLADLCVVLCGNTLNFARALQSAALA